MDCEPPFLDTYKTLLQTYLGEYSSQNDDVVLPCSESYELPSIDLGRLRNLDDDNDERENCIAELAEAARKWGFFQVVNHGISKDLMESMVFEEMKLFYQPFVKKACLEGYLGYRWGNPSATHLGQLMWSEAFHFSLANISNMEQCKNLRSSIEAFAAAITPLAESLSEILARNLNMKYSNNYYNYFRENCKLESSILRLNRYPPCPISSKVYGLIPHSDTSFLTIVYQDLVGGLQLMKDGKWVGVKPNQGALVVNVGDLFQAMSNGVYKSIKHRVVVAEKVERFSMAFFYCPNEEAVIQSYNKPAIYRKFTLKEYRKQNEKDVKQTGDKVGLSRFLI